MSKNNLEKQIKEEQSNLDQLKSKQEESSKNLQELKQGPEFKQLQKDKEELNSIKDKIQELKTDIDKKLDEKIKFQPEAAKIYTRFFHLLNRIPVPLLLIFILGIYFFLIFLVIW